MRSPAVALPFLVALVIPASSNCLASGFVHHNEGSGINRGLMLEDFKFARAEHAIEHGTMEYRLAESSTGAKHWAGLEAERKVRADLEDGTRVVGEFVRLESDTLVLSNVQFLERTGQDSSARPELRGNRRFEVVGQEASARVPMTVVEELHVRKGQALKGAAIGALIGLTVGGVLALTSDDDFGGGVIMGGLLAVAFPLVGILIGGLDHWVEIHPSD